MKFRTAAACRIAKIDRNRFNEAVAAGNYPCAPATVAGASRLFAEDDILALYAYGRLLAFGFTPSHAGEYACRVRQALDSKPKVKTVAVAFALNSLKRTLIDERPALLSPDNPVFERFEFEIASMRKYVRKEMEDEAQSIGEED